MLLSSRRAAGAAAAAAAKCSVLCVTITLVLPRATTVAELLGTVANKLQEGQSKPP